jgi:hypothetical protein
MRSVGKSAQFCGYSRALRQASLFSAVAGHMRWRQE